MYRVYETIGLPFEVIFTKLQQDRRIPCWTSLVEEMRKAGIGDRKILAMLQDPIDLVFGREFGEVVRSGIQRLLAGGL